MKIWHSIIIAIAIIVGFALHAAIRSIPEHARAQRGYEMQVRMMEMTPRELIIGDTSVLYLPRISYRDLSIDVNYEFYTYADGELKKVNMTGDEGRS
jgi:hypothetical protein